MYLLAKFENDESGNLVFREPEIYSDEVSIDRDEEREIVGGCWSSTTRIGAIVVKKGPDR
jgi:hypothetical protein